MKETHLRVQELCEYLRIKDPTLYEWIRKGTIPSGFKIGKIRLWEKSVIDKWIESKKKEAQ